MAKHCSLCAWLGGRGTTGAPDGLGVRCGVGRGVDTTVGEVPLPKGQLDGTAHAVHVLLPSAQNAPAGHTTSDELSGQ